jgi:hypothetical protein
MMDEHYTRILGEKYKSMPPDGGWLHE